MVFVRMVESRIGKAAKCYRNGDREKRIVGPSNARMEYVVTRVKLMKRREKKRAHTSSDCVQFENGSGMER